MFPGPHDVIIYNDAGEPIGWETQGVPWEDYWCDDCGFAHIGPCQGPYDPYDNDCEDIEEDDEGSPPERRDAGAEVDQR